MKRYAIIANEPHESKDGLWVRFKNHEEEIQKLIDAGMEENRKAEAWKEKARQQLKKRILTDDVEWQQIEVIIDEVLK